MATYAYPIPNQFHGLSPSDVDAQVLDSARSSAGASPVEMNRTDTSDDASSSSSHPSPPPQSPPPSESPPLDQSLSQPSSSDQTPSLKADSLTENDPIEDEVEPVAESTSSKPTTSRFSTHAKPFVPGLGYHPIPNDHPDTKKPSSNVYFHLMCEEMIKCPYGPNCDLYAEIQGPATVRTLGNFETVSKPLDLLVPPHLHVYQFFDEVGILRHIVVSRAPIKPDEMSTEELDQRVESQPDIPKVEFQQNEASSSGGSSGQGGSDEQVGHQGGHQGQHQTHHQNGNHRGNWDRNNRGQWDGNRRTHNSGNYNNGHSNSSNRGNRNRNARHRNEFQGGRSRGSYGNYATNHQRHHVMDNGPQVDPNAQRIVNQPENGHGPIPMEPIMVPMMVPMQAPEMAPIPQGSLLGEPQGIPMHEMQHIPPQDYQQQDPMYVPGNMGAAPPVPYGYIHQGDPNVNNNNWGEPHVIVGEEQALVNLLSSVNTPMIVRPFPTGAEFLFKIIIPLDFQFVNGVAQFYTVGIHDITYHVIVFDRANEIISNTPMEMTRDANDPMKALFTVNSLRPNTSYSVAIYTSLESKGLFGKKCESLSFITAPGRPEPPTDIDCTGSGQHFISLEWKPSVNNGAFVSRYHVYIHEDKFGNGRMIKTDDAKLEIKSLVESKVYKIFIFAINALGESLTCTEFDGFTKCTRAPIPQTNVRAVSRTANTIDVNWEFINVRTQAEPANEANQNDTTAIVSRTPWEPKHVGYVDNCPKMEWKTYEDPSGYSYIAEGSTFDNPDRFYRIYQGDQPYLTITDTKIHYLRIIHFYQQRIRSRPSMTVVVPRDYLKIRPERVKDVKLTFQQDGEILVEWTKLPLENWNIPETAEVVYYAQRCDSSENDVIGVKDENHCVFKKIPGETKITVQVRAALYYREQFIHGDWSIPTSLTTPRYLPPPVFNVKFDLKTSTLAWECQDHSSDLKFVLKVEQQRIGKNVMKVTTRARNVVVDGLQLGGHYRAIIATETNVGRCKEDEWFDFNIPAERPSAPENVELVNIRSNSCEVIWKAAEPNGSKISNYYIRVMHDEKLRELTVAPVNNQTDYKLLIRELKMDTEYLVIVSARNDPGFSPKVELKLKTLLNIPPIPKIFGDCEPNNLKIFWDHVTSSPSVSYRLVRINKDGQNVHLFEGDNNLFKVKNLQENTVYQFKLRVYDRIMESAAWSDVFDFKTTIAPPPTIKKAPIISLVTDETHVYHIEWDKSLPQNSRIPQSYRLQTVDATIKGAKWETAYEGPLISFDLNTEQFPGAIHVRALCVRRVGNEDLCGSPSPVGYIANSPPEVEEVEVEDSVPAISWWWSKRGFLNVCLAIIALFFFGSFSGFFTLGFLGWLNPYYSGN